jgi:predicted DNA-binding transcriptional regulator AlpA
MRLSELADLPATLTTEQAAAVYGVGVDHLWKLAREGDAPIEPLHLGRKIVWPTAKVLASLGLDLPTQGDADATVIPLRLA